MIFLPPAALPDPSHDALRQRAPFHRHTLLAFLCALGLVTTAAATLVSGVSGVFAFDDNPAAFFRADRAMRAGGASRASLPAPRASAAPSLLAGRQANADKPARARAKPTKKQLAAKPGRKPEKNTERVRLAASTPSAESMRAVLDNPAAAPLTGNGSRSVCVRLCDGYHFPVGNSSDAGDVVAHEATCTATCPGAPTRLFVLPSGTDDISRAYSARGGQSYSSLPVALRHVQKRDNTCTCRPANSPQQAAVSLYRDFTLRQGDAVMTGQGFRVFRGARQLPYQARDFSAVPSSPIGKSEKRMLQAIESASIPARDTWREKPLSAPVSTARPIPALGPFRVNRTPQNVAENGAVASGPNSGAIQ